MRPLASGTKPVKVAVTLIVVAILLDSSLLVSASLPQVRHLAPSSSQSGSSVGALLATPSGFWAFTDGKYLPANMSTRGEIMAFILTNPGVYLREISEELGVSMGAVQYHVWVLGRSGEVEECRSGRYRRLFGANRYPENERRILALLRQGTAGRVLLALSERPLTHLRLACLLGISSQALSWHTKRLREIGAMTIAVSSHGERLYVLADEIREEIRACSAVPRGAMSQAIPTRPAR